MFVIGQAKREKCEADVAISCAKSYIATEGDVLETVTIKDTTLRCMPPVPLEAGREYTVQEIIDLAGGLHLVRK